MNREYGISHRDILSVIDLLLTLPASSAEVERGFSQLKLLKTDMRSKLKESHLNDLMSIKLLSAPVSEFNPTEAIQLWNKSGVRPRRPNFKNTKKSKGKALEPILSRAERVLPPVAEVRVVVVDEPTADLADKDDGESRIGDVGEVTEDGQEEESDAGGDLDVIDKGEDSDENDSGVEDASDMDSDVEERHVENLIKKYL